MPPDRVGLALAVLLCVGLPLVLGLWGEVLAGVGGLLVLFWPHAKRALRVARNAPDVRPLSH